LKRLDFVPCLQTTTNRSKIKCLDKQRALVHPQKNLSRDLLVSEYLTVVFLDSRRKEVLSHLIGCPGLHLQPSVSTLFLFISLFTVYV
jgi:hypothetical protein